MGKKVLLIEDEPNIIEAISFILKRDGWVVVGGAGSHGVKAADALAAECFADAGAAGFGVTVFSGRSGY